MDWRLLFLGENYPHRREEIIELSAKLFREKGYDKTSVNEIADEAGFSKPALYYYFKEKREILWEICNKARSKALMEARKISNQKLPPKEKMQLMLLTHTTLLSQDIYLWSVFFNEETSLPEEKQAIIHKYRREYEKIFEEIYADGIKSGHFRDLSPKLVIRIILGSINWIYKWYDPTKYTTPQEIFEHYYTILANGFLIGKE